MTSQAAARRTLCTVQAAACIVRIIAFVDLIAGVLSAIFREVDAVSCALLLIGSAAFVQPLLLACLYSRKPETRTRSCVVLGKYVLYFWLFVLNYAVAPFILYGLLYVIAIGNFVFYYKDMAISIFLMLVVVITSAMLTVVNLYTFCILHKNGCCFLYRLRKDIEEADASSSNPDGVQLLTCTGSQLPVQSISVSNQTGEGVPACVVGMEPGKCF